MEFCGTDYLFFRPERGNDFVSIAELGGGDFNLGQLYRTVSPALAFQYISPKPPSDLSVGKAKDLATLGRIPPYFNNLNSWLGQTMQRDCPQVLYCVLISMHDALAIIFHP